MLQLMETGPSTPVSTQGVGATIAALGTAFLAGLDGVFFGTLIMWLIHTILQVGHHRARRQQFGAPQLSQQFGLLVSILCAWAMLVVIEDVFVGHGFGVPVLFLGMVGILGFLARQNAKLLSYRFPGFDEWLSDHTPTISKGVRRTPPDDDGDGQ